MMLALLFSLVAVASASCWKAPQHGAERVTSRQVGPATEVVTLGMRKIVGLHPRHLLSLPWQGYRYHFERTLPNSLKAPLITSMARYGHGIWWQGREVSWVVFGDLSGQFYWKADYDGSRDLGNDPTYRFSSQEVPHRQEIIVSDIRDGELFRISIYNDKPSPLVVEETGLRTGVIRDLKNRTRLVLGVLERRGKIVALVRDTNGNQRIDDLDLEHAVPYDGDSITIGMGRLCFEVESLGQALLYVSRVDNTLACLPDLYEI